MTRVKLIGVGRRKWIVVFYSDDGIRSSAMLDRPAACRLAARVLARAKREVGA